MLCELRVKNLALIESLALSFDQGNVAELVVMTGETGAGKSIMLRAIQLLQGGRASADWIRTGSTSCEIEALFELGPHHGRLQEKLEQGGFASDGSIVIKRILTDDGRSRFFINGSLATAKNTAELTIDLLNIASQHDHQQLLQPALHLDIIDTVGELWDFRQKLGELFNRWQEKKQRLADLRRQEQDKEQRLDFLKFQLDEIGKAALTPGEDEELAAEKKRLKNAQALIKVSQESYRLLSHDLLESLIQLRQQMGQLVALDSSVEKLAEDIVGFTFIAEDHAALLREYKDRLEEDPYRLEQVTERLDVIQQFKRKYGETIGEILNFAKSCEAEIAQYENMDKVIQQLVAEVAGLEKELLGQAKILSQRRLATGKEMEQAMARELQSLAFDGAGFFVRWQEIEEGLEKMRVSGWDRGEFYFSPNPGESAKPLAKIASGGELSRLMLAMKCLLARKDMVDTVIFDEVDAGIGGQAAEAVARKIEELAGHHQVFCITHLPQIAARGSLHYRVAKTVENGRTQSTVRLLSKEERVGELARMLAGDGATAQTHAFARELLQRRGAGA